MYGCGVENNKKDKAYEGQIKIQQRSHTSKKFYVAKLSITLSCLVQHKKKTPVKSTRYPFDILSRVFKII